MKNTLVTSLALLTLLFAACMPSTPPALTGGGSMDMFSPVKLRLHPLSRFVATPPTVEARIEFTDQFGDVTKSPGTLYFELFRYEQFTPNHHGERINLYNFQLNTPDANKMYWDPITRTYLFKLPLPADALKAADTRLILSVTLNPATAGAPRLQDDLTIPITK